MHASNTAEQEDTTGRVSTAPSLQRSSSFFHTVAALLGVTPLSSTRPPIMLHGDPRPPETAIELVSSRYPYFYFESMSG